MEKLQGFRSETFEKGFSYEGLRVSILGDSISTFAGISTGNPHYPNDLLNVSLTDTWWQKVIVALKMELLVNNSYAGSCVLGECDGRSGYPFRCVDLSKNGIDPDVILVFLGTNDFTNRAGRVMGTESAIDYSSIISENGDGSYSYAHPATVCEAYAMMLHKMRCRYPDAKLFCMTIPRRRDPVFLPKNQTNCGQPIAFNKDLKAIICRFGGWVVDLERCYGDTSDPDVFDRFIPDKWLHPGPLGMDCIARAVLDEMKRANGSL